MDDKERDKLLNKISSKIFRPSDHLGIGFLGGLFFFIALCYVVLGLAAWYQFWNGVYLFSAKELRSLVLGYSLEFYDTCIVFLRVLIMYLALVPLLFWASCSGHAETAYMSERESSWLDILWWFGFWSAICLLSVFPFAIGIPKPLID